MKKLFDNEEENDDAPLNQGPDTRGKNVDDEDEEFIPIKFNRDKIFENDYNTGNLDFEEYSNLPKVDIFYAEDNLKECYDSYEYSRALKLENFIDEYFKRTEFSALFSIKKKIPKQTLPQVYVCIREQFENHDYTGVEIFTSIADYFGINYEVLYENIPSVYRAELVKELDEKYGVLKKRGVKRLF
jgi:hypothetical protein